MADEIVPARDEDGRAIEQATLIRFYVMHVVFLPAALGVLFAYHMWRVRKDGGLARADRDEVLQTPRTTAPSPTKTYTLLGVARGTAPAVTVRFTGERRAFWGLLVRGAVFLALTLGIYRFWLATDIRRFLWSNTEVAGDSLEAALRLARDSDLVRRSGLYGLR